jgi:hypothetical protein
MQVSRSDRSDTGVHRRAGARVSSIRSPGDYALRDGSPAIDATLAAARVRRVAYRPAGAVRI